MGRRRKSDWEVYMEIMAEERKRREFEEYYLEREEEFDWDSGSRILCEEYSEYFHEWWQPDKFKWKGGSYFLCKHCAEYFHTWWDPDRFDWENCGWALAMYCYRYFPKWWNPERYNWEKDAEELIYCKDWKSDWMPELKKRYKEGVVKEGEYLKIMNIATGKVKWERY